MKRALLIIFVLLFATNAWCLVDSNATYKTKELYTQLQNAQGNNILLGDIIYSSTDLNQSYLITGKYPYVVGIDFEKYYSNPTTWYELVKLAKNHYRQGGIIIIMWHMGNWSSGGDSWDITFSDIQDMLPGGSARSVYLARLAEFVSFCQSFVDDNGTPIPFIFRPFHENDANWFWWGSTGGTDAEFISLWQDLIVYLRDTSNIHNILYCYSPEIIGGYTYDGTLYPGDEYVDIFGLDRYSNSGTITDVLSYYQDAYDASVSHNKVFAITEGLRDLNTNPLSDFWTTYWLNPLLLDNKANKASFICFYADDWWCADGRSDEGSFLTMSQNSYIRLLPYQDSITNSNKVCEYFNVNDRYSSHNVYNNTFVSNGTNTPIDIRYTLTDYYSMGLSVTAPAAATAISSDTTTDISVTNIDGSSWHVTYGKTFTQETGKKYRFCATISADTSGTITHNIQQSADPYTTYESTNLSITTVPNDFYVEYTGVANNLVQHRLLLGQIVNGYHITNMRLEELGNENSIIKNNVIETSGTKSIDVPEGTILDYNCYYDTTGNYQFVYDGVSYTSFSTYQSASGQDLHSIASDPLLNSDYTLKSRSPCIDSGVEVEVNKDYANFPRPSGKGWDIGACEFNQNILGIQRMQKPSLDKIKMQHIWN